MMVTHACTDTQTFLEERKKWYKNNGSRSIHGSSKPSIHLRYLLILEVVYIAHKCLFNVVALYDDSESVCLPPPPTTTAQTWTSRFTWSQSNSNFFLRSSLFALCSRQWCDLSSNARNLSECESKREREGEQRNKYSHLFQFTIERLNIEPSQLSLSPSLSRCSNSQRHSFFKYILLRMIVWLKEAKENTIRKDW